MFFQPKSQISATFGGAFDSVACGSRIISYLL